MANQPTTRSEMNALPLKAWREADLVNRDDRRDDALPTERSHQDLLAEITALTKERDALKAEKEQRDKLHGQIMNLRCEYVGKQPSPHRAGYREGFKDARHAAAELVVSVLSSADPEAK